MIKLKNKKEIYLDYASATPIDKEVLKTMKSCDVLYANSNSIHEAGLKVRNKIEESREKIAKMMNAHSDEIIFTGSGTESDALAILGLINHKQNSSTPGVGRLPHIMTTSIEHPAVLENCKMLEERNLAEVTYLNPDKDGLINPKDIKGALKENTILVSIMYANNEIGTIQPIQEIAKEIRYYKKTKIKSGEKYSFSGAWETVEPSTRNFSAEKYPCPEKEYFLQDIYPLFHIDACQAMNYLFTENIEKLGIDMMTFNSSKIYGPKGVGILYKKRGIELSPIYSGGGQEFGLRSGTENIVSIVGIAKALEITNKIKDKEVERLTKIRNYGIEKLLKLKEKTGYEIILNGSLEVRLPNIINISILGISSELLVIELSAKGIYVSEKSACQSENDNGSYVIKAIRNAEDGNSNIKSDPTSGSLRISLGRQTAKKDMDILVCSLTKILLKYKNYRDVI